MTRAALACLLIAAACQNAPTTPRAVARPAAVPAGKRTTDGGIAMENLDAGVRAAEKALAHERTADARLTLSSLLGTRAQILGSVTDLERAARLTDEAVAAEPSAKTLLARAASRAALHRFAEARSDLQAAAALATPADDLSWTIGAQRAGLDEAVGRVDAALVERQLATGRWPSFDHLSALAAVVGDLGDRDAAHRLFVRALAAYRDVSPFAVAYLELQEGLMWERLGAYSHARDLYEQAHARLPAYSTVTIHLAGVEAAMGDVAAALAVLEPLLPVSEDPEVAAQLAALYRRAHRTEETSTLVARARARYEELLARHPEAYADHAARFFLGIGDDPVRARALAEQNLAVRRTGDAFALAIDAALAAGDAPSACRNADAALSELHRSEALLAAAARAHDACRL